MARFQAGDALRYTQGVDRSLTEVAALFLADHPNEPPAGAEEFLVDACGVTLEDAGAAVGLLDLDGATPGAPAKSWLESAKKPDLVEILTAFEVEFPKKAGVEELRALAAQLEADITALTAEG